jgi:hypothetical protein|tara:strand:- start:232 stop:363 length:132 start_codon:yes stop_codon:yes gene_type:complete
MDRTEFFDWLEDCPTHKHNITMDEDEFITVCFPVFDKDEDEEA